jgi:hypothetical protein
LIACYQNQVVTATGQAVGVDRADPARGTGDEGRAERRSVTHIQASFRAVTTEGDLKLAHPMTA